MEAMVLNQAQAVTRQHSLLLVKTMISHPTTVYKIVLLVIWHNLSNIAVETRMMIVKILKDRILKNKWC